MSRPANKSLAKRKGQEHPLRRIIRQNIRNRRMSLGISQRDLGDRVGVTKNWIQQIESPHGDEVPNVYMLFDIASEFGCTPADILTPGKFQAGIGAEEDLRKHLALTRRRGE